MDVEEMEREVMAKPVASRPNCSGFKSFSGLLAGAIESTCSSSLPKPIVAAIRPKTVRFRPAAMSQIATSPAISSRVEIPRMVTCDPSSEDLKSRGKTTAIFKPKAKLVTRLPISLLADTGSFHTSHQPAQLPRAEAPRIGDFAANLKLLVRQADRMSEPSKAAPQCLAEEGNRSLNMTSNEDGTSYVGYNWRKYGQKQVKGSEYPRSYYKCTHPKCPAKKKVERSFDGKIAEIVYKGEHTHAKPQPPKRGFLGTYTGLVPTTDDLAGQILTSHLGADFIGEGNKCRLENHNTIGSSSLLTYPGKGRLGCEPDSSCSPTSGFGEGIQRDGPRNKRRKGESQLREAGISCEVIRDGFMVQSSTNNDPLGDGFRWRKYGQKVVKGSSYPRSYYRCTSLKCTVRKHVERASDDPTSFVTTYEGKHNHEMPTRSGNLSGSHK